MRTNLGLKRYLKWQLQDKLWASHVLLLNLRCPHDPPVSCAHPVLQAGGKLALDTSSFQTRAWSCECQLRINRWYWAQKPKRKQVGKWVVTFIWLGRAGPTPSPGHQHTGGGSGQELGRSWGGQARPAEGRKYPVSRASPLVSPPTRTPACQAWERYRIHDKEKVLGCDPMSWSSGGWGASAPARPGSVGRQPPLTAEFQLLVVKR